MSTPNDLSNGPSGQANKAAGSTGPSTPAAPAHLTPSNAAVASSTITSGLNAQNNAGTPRSNPPTMYPSPANHRSPLNIKSPAAARSHGATPMARAASANASSNALGGTPMQRGHTSIGMKSTGTPGRFGGQAAGKTLPGSSNLAAPGAGLGIAAQGLAAGSPGINESSPNIGGVAGNAALNSIAGFGTPSAGSTTGAGGPGVVPGGIDMDVSFSGLGLSMASNFSAMGSSGGGRVDDEERRRRLESVLDTLRKRPGRVSRDAVERLGRRCELDMHIEEDELSLAGKNAVMLEVQFKPHSPLVERVSVAFPTASDALAAHASKASKILQSDLTPHSGTATINASLDKFADNLERLARLDKLSIPGANCFEAIFGVYTSLRKLYEHEKRTAETLLATKSKSTPREIDTEVVCKQSGCPKMHARRRVGLSLDYWINRRLVALDEEYAVADGDEMEVDDQTKERRDSDKDVIHGEHSETFASITIECEASSPALYPPIRITDAWLSDNTGKTKNETGNGNEGVEPTPDMTSKDNGLSNEIEWQEPPPPLIPTAGPDPMSGLASTHPTQPQARFVAKFEPAVVLPWDVAAWIYDSVETNIMQENPAPETLEKLLLAKSPVEMGRASRDSQPVISTDSTYLFAKRHIVAYHHNMESDSHNWDVRLFPTRTEAAIQLQKLPFSHPRQIVTILPILRQYIFLSRLLQNTLDSDHPDTIKEPQNNTTNNSQVSIIRQPDSSGSSQRTKTHSAYSAAAAVATVEADLASFLSDAEDTKSSCPRALDIAISLSTPPPKPNSILPPLRAPRLMVTLAGIKFPQSRRDSHTETHTVRVIFTILPNADVDIEVEDVGGENLYGNESEIEAAGDGQTVADGKAETDGGTNAAKTDSQGNEVITNHDKLAGEQARNQKLKEAVLQGMLVSEDLVIWGEWLRGKFPE